jgi:glycosyltransferase involved in cell wall biosynthesis
VKILYLITKSNWGGAQRHVFDLAVAAKKNNQEAVVALGGEGILRERLREEGVTTRPIGKLGRDVSVAADSASLFEIFKIIREIKPDILHLHSPKAAGLGSFAGKLLGVKKIIYTVHGWAFNEDRTFFQKVPIVFFSWLTMLFCTQVILLSEKEMSQTLLFPWVKEKLRMVRNGINPPKFYATSSAQQFFQTKVSEPLSKKFVIGTIAELHPNKGLIHAINAFEKLMNSNSSFVFFIIGEGEQRAELEELIKQKKLEQHVILLGYVPHAAEYLRGLNLFLLPSVKEALPYCLIEAGFAGIPVVATTVGGIPELISDMESGILIQPKKSDEICHAIQFLIEHKNIQREYARNFQERVKNLYNLDQMIQATFKIYTEVPAKRR